MGTGYAEQCNNCMAFRKFGICGTNNMQ